MKSHPQLDLAKKLMLMSQTLINYETIEAAKKKEAREHDPLVNELSEILGGKVAQLVSEMLGKSFPGVKLAKMREAIRIDTANAFRKSMKRNFNAYYDEVKNPAQKIVNKSKEEVKEEVKPKTEEK